MVTDNRKNFCNPVGACIARPPEQGWIFCRTNGVTQSVGALRGSPAAGLGGSANRPPKSTEILQNTSSVVSYTFIKFTLCYVRFFATLRMTNQNKPRRGRRPRRPVESDEILRNNTEVVPYTFIKSTQCYVRFFKTDSRKGCPYGICVTFGLCRVRFFASLRMTNTRGTTNLHNFHTLSTVEWES